MSSVVNARLAYDTANIIVAVVSDAPCRHFENHLETTEEEALPRFLNAVSKQVTGQTLALKAGVACHCRR